MPVFEEKMSWLIALIIVSIFIVVILILYKDVILETISKKIDIGIIKKVLP